MIELIYDKIVMMTLIVINWPKLNEKILKAARGSQIIDRLVTF